MRNHKPHFQLTSLPFLPYNDKLILGDVIHNEPTEAGFDQHHNNNAANLPVVDKAVTGGISFLFYAPLPENPAEAAYIVAGNRS